MKNILNTYDRSKLIEMGIIVESENINLENPEELNDALDNKEIDSFPEANYELQDEIIRFFSNNPGASPELFRQFATSIAIDPEELQKQMNILFTQLLKIYLNDSEEMGYGSALVDDEVSDEIRQLVAPQPQE